MTIACLAASLLSLGYQLPQAPGRSLRAPAPSMETRLNNYVLPGPMKPLGNQVMVKLRKVDDKTTGGLFVPTGETEKPKEGTVVMAGPGTHHPETGAMMECPVKEGDLVLLSDLYGEKVDYNGEQHIFCDARSLLGSFDNQELAVKNFKPLGDRLMVAIAEMETETTTGIALAGLEDEEGNSGEVVSVGPGSLTAKGDLVEPAVAAGDSVMYVRHRGVEVTVEGKPFVVIQEGDCLVKW